MKKRDINRWESFEEKRRMQLFLLNLQVNDISLGVLNVDVDYLLGVLVQTVGYAFRQFLGVLVVSREVLFGFA